MPSVRHSGVLRDASLRVQAALSAPHLDRRSELPFKVEWHRKVGERGALLLRQEHTRAALATQLPLLLTRHPAPAYISQRNNCNAVGTSFWRPARCITQGAGSTQRTTP